MTLLTRLEEKLIYRRRLELLHYCCGTAASLANPFTCKYTRVYSNELEVFLVSGYPPAYPIRSSRGHMQCGTSSLCSLTLHAAPHVQGKAQQRPMDMMDTYINPVPTSAHMHMRMAHKPKTTLETECQLLYRDPKEAGEQLRTR